MSRRSAFTLIELLVVLAILTLLVSILTPSLGRARELARRAACAGNCRGLATAQLLYLEANNQVFMRGGLESGGTAGSAFPTWHTDWAHFYDAYLGGNHAAYNRRDLISILVCPSNRKDQYWPRLPYGYFTGGATDWPLRVEALLKVARKYAIPNRQPALFADATQRPESNVSWPGNVNHRDRQTGWPEGGNVAHLDGSTRWVDGYPSAAEECYVNNSSSFYWLLPTTTVGPRVETSGTAAGYLSTAGGDTTVRIGATGKTIAEAFGP